MLVTGLTSTGCTKCERAKQLLAGYPVKWINVDNDEYWKDEAKKFTDTLPFFIIGEDDNIIYTKSIIKVQNLFIKKYGYITTPYYEIICVECGLTGCVAVYMLDSENICICGGKMIDRREYDENKK
jgi:hypothetical protein